MDQDYICLLFHQSHLLLHWQEKNHNHVKQDESRIWCFFFFEMWYDQMTNIQVPASDKTFKKFAENFQSTFFSFDIKATTYHKPAKLS